MTQFLRYSPQNKTFEYVTNQTNGQSLIENRFTYLKRDSKRRLWLIGEKGVSVYIEQKDGLLNSHLLPENSPLSYKGVNCVHEAHNGIFWIGTRNGIWRFDERKKSLNNTQRTMVFPIM